VWIVIHGMTVAHDHPAGDRIVKYVKPIPTPPAMSWLEVQPVPQRVPVAVVLELRYVMWLP
jgi:hypothetical protein